MVLCGLVLFGPAGCPTCPAGPGWRLTCVTNWEEREGKPADRRHCGGRTEETFTNKSTAFFNPTTMIFEQERCSGGDTREYGDYTDGRFCPRRIASPSASKGPGTNRASCSQERRVPPITSEGLRNKQRQKKWATTRVGLQVRRFSGAERRRQTVTLGHTYKAGRTIYHVPMGGTAGRDFQRMESFRPPARPKCDSLDEAQRGARRPLGRNERR